MQTSVRYVESTALWDSFEDRVADMVRQTRDIVRQTRSVSVGELGGGCNPTMTLADRLDFPIELTVLDVSADELAKGPPDTTKLCVDLCAPEPPVEKRFDLVFSRMLCEHVSSGLRFHRNCLTALKPGGYAVHFFPTLVASPFVLNRLLPTRLSTRLLETVFPARRPDGNHPKFPATYQWCWGPTNRQLARLRSVGFDVVSYEAGIGHHYYMKVPGLRWLERAKTAWTLRNPSPYLCAYALVVLRRPDIDQDR